MLGLFRRLARQRNHTPRPVAIQVGTKVDLTLGRDEKLSWLFIDEIIDDDFYRLSNGIHLYRQRELPGENPALAGRWLYGPAPWRGDGRPVTGIVFYEVAKSEPLSYSPQEIATIKSTTAIKILLKPDTAGARPHQ